MTYITGKSKSLEDITLEDALQHPIWEWAYGEEGVEGQDETWQRPITSTTNVTNNMVQPAITLKIKNSDYYASAEYNQDNDQLEAIAVWQHNQWVVLGKMDNLVLPVIFVAIPTINGVSNVAFEYTSWDVDGATRMKQT
jgi:hypothetical protein